MSGTDFIITPDREFLQFIYDRLIHHHDENPNVDYMISLKQRIDNIELKTPISRFDVDNKKTIIFKVLNKSKHTFMLDFFHDEIDDENIIIIHVKDSLTKEKN